MGRKYNIAVAGATGAVGRKLIEVLENRKFPAGNISLLASGRSAGEELTAFGRSVKVQELSQFSFTETDIAFFSAGSKISLTEVPRAAEEGCIVIDNSSAFRGDAEVPLVIPEINPEDLDGHRGIISNPNCTTAIMLTVLDPVYRYAGIDKIIVSTYQSVSGAGQKGISELNRQIKDIEEGNDPDITHFPYRIAYNVIPHIDDFTYGGYTKEEIKMQNETVKILHDGCIRVSATCVRVPVISVHSMSVTVLTDKKISAVKASELIGSAPGVKVLDDIRNNLYPVPSGTEGKYDCFAGRIREDSAFGNGLSLWICGDQLLKGAALNAVQIAEKMIERSLI